ncbi:MAG: molybdopterin-dependent oxidoreductase [Sphingorhabdus sp.]|nr:molybdopterin-dependent oxidoreductase [Sphingorhabdus sp.]
MTDRPGIELTRRNLLIGGGAGVGLLVAWAIWPREYLPNMMVEKGEHLFGPWLKIGEDGRVTIAVPQAEMGQGSYTALAQIVAGELGADWRTVAVQPAMPSPVFANDLFVREWSSAFMPASVGALADTGLAGALGKEWAKRSGFMITGGSTSIRQFEHPCRAAGAAARVLLCQAAAARWDTAWENCDTANGFVTFERKRIPFAELVAEAASYDAPSPIPLRASPVNGLSGKEAVRLDVAAKVDGSANFAGDLRLPDMLYASVRAGPIGDTRLKEIDRAGASGIKGIVDIVRTDGWVAALATNWWAANKALDAMSPVFATTGRMPDSATMSETMERALNKGPGSRLVDIGSVDGSLDKAADTRVYRSQYAVQPAVHAPLETRSATAAYKNGRLTLWLATQAPEAARQAAASAVGIASDDVTLIQMLAGGSFGRNLDSQIAAQAAILARHVERPVQVVWSRP